MLSLPPGWLAKMNVIWGLGVTINKLKDKECMGKQQNLLKVKSEGKAIKGEWWAPAAQLKTTVAFRTG
jgi:hypothetical protein